jgi:hypothetical protein
MRRKVVLFSALAVVGLVLLGIVSAVTVYALAVDSPTQTEVLEAAPVQAEQVEKPVLKYERASFGGGCSRYKSTMQMTEAPADKVVEDQLLTQAAVD